MKQENHYLIVTSGQGRRRDLLHSSAVTIDRVAKHDFTARLRNKEVAIQLA